MTRSPGETVALLIVTLVSAQLGSPLRSRETSGREDSCEQPLCDRVALDARQQLLSGTSSSTMRSTGNSVEEMQSSCRSRRYAKYSVVGLSQR